VPTALDGYRSFFPWVETHNYNIGRADGTGKGKDLMQVYKLLQIFQSVQI